MDKSREEISVVEQDGPLLSVIKTNVNLSRLPFFALSRQGLKDELNKEWRFSKVRDNKRCELLWRVIATPFYGYPSPFAQRIHRAIEYILTQNGFPVQEYIDFSFYEIVDIMGLKESGRTYEKIRYALMSITTTTIESQGTFCYLEDGEKRFIDEAFHLYDNVIFAGRQLPDGTRADRNRIYFNKWYLKSLNSLYIKPLDFPYWNSLKSDIARRLYEYLRFISFATRCKPFKIGYYRLCEFLPLKPQKYFSDAQRQMRAAHKELMNTGFLKKVAWRKSKTDPKKWIITYYFGLRAKSEHKRGFNDDTYRPALLAVETADISEIEEIIEQEEEKEQEIKSKRKKHTKEEETPKPFAQELINRGITKSVAIDFAESFSDLHILEKIQMHDYKKETGELTTNAAGWLREAIVHDYKPSEQQLKKQAQLQKKQAQQQEQRTLEEKAKQIQEQRLLEALSYFPEEEQWVRERVVEHVNVRETTIKAFGGEQFTQEEIEEMYLRFKAESPKTLEEKRAWLISHDSKYSLSSIISELKAEQQKSQTEASASTTNELQFPLNSIEDVLTEVARQQAFFEATQKRRGNAEEPEADEYYDDERVEHR
jgi:hypothetical protein